MSKILSKNYLSLIFLFLTLGLSFFVLFSKIDTLPLEPYSFDMIHDVARAKSILQGQRPVFFLDADFPAGGVEVGFYYLVAFLSWLTHFSVSYTLFKTVAASIAFISTILLYFLLKKEFGEIIASFCSLFFSVSSWLFLITRVAYRGVVLIPIMIYIIWFLKDLSRRSVWNYFCLGFFSAIGVYTNTVFMFFFPVIFLLLLLIGFFSKVTFKNFSLKLSLFLLIFIFIYSPAIKYAYSNYERFFGRMIYRQNERKAMGLSGKKYLFRMVDNYRKVVLFVYKEGTGQGFPHYVNVYGGASLYEKFTATLFILGFFTALRSLFIRKRFFFSFVVLLFLLVSPLPSVFYSSGFEGEIPDVFRLVGGIIPGFIIIANGLFTVREIFVYVFFPKKLIFVKNIVYFSLIFLLSIFIFKENYRRNYFLYPQQYAWQNYPVYHSLAKEINNFNGRIFLLMSYPFDWQVLKFYLSEGKISQITLSETINTKPTYTLEKFLVICDYHCREKQETNGSGKCQINETYSEKGKYIYSINLCNRSN